MHRMIQKYKMANNVEIFIDVKELIDVLLHFYDHQFENGIYNLGTGKANTFNELASIFLALWN